MKVFS